MGHPLDRTEMGRTKKAIVGGQNMTAVPIKVKMKLAEKGGTDYEPQKLSFKMQNPIFFKIRRVNVYITESLSCTPETNTTL